MTRSREPCVTTWGQRLSIRRGQGAETNVNTQFLSFHANTRLEKTFREAIHPVSPLHFTNKGRGPCLALRLPGATPAQGCLAQTVGDKASPASGGGAQDHRDSRSPCRACGGRPSALCGGGEGRGAQDHSRVQSRTVTQSWWRQAICPLGERGREGSQASGRPLRLSQAEEETAV